MEEDHVFYDMCWGACMFDKTFQISVPKDVCKYRWLADFLFDIKNIVKISDFCFIQVQNAENTWLDTPNEM